MQHVKLNASFESIIIEQLIEFFEFKDIFVWTYKDMKGISLEITQHKIEFDTTILHAHQMRYQLNPYYIAIMKQNINKLFTIGFIKLVEEATWLSLILVVFKKNGKLRICVDFRKLNATTKKDPYLFITFHE